MKVLGNARQGGALRIATEVVRQMRHCGEVALLLGRRGDVILLPHWAPDYADALKRTRHLCGVYRDQHAGQVTASGVCEDLVESWRGLRGAV